MDMTMHHLKVPRSFFCSDAPRRGRRTNIPVFLTKIFLVLAAESSSAHGLIQSPPSRNWFCGAITKPDQVRNGTAQYPICGDAFNAPGLDPNQGYNFMSVLTHDQGLSVAGPRSNVCSYNAETWKGTATVWDQPINWPTTTLSSGLQTLTWNIQWGPHFLDTQEFKYWITKSDFIYRSGTPIRPEDLEAEPFCSLVYDDQKPNGNPNVIPDKANALFRTRCTIPSRKGRHLIYGEWGRNAWTYERFHSCVDVVFDAAQNSITPIMSLSSDSNTLHGAGSLLLDARSSSGGSGALRYTWSVSAKNPALYHLDQPNQAVTVLHYDSPTSVSELNLTLTATDGIKTASATRSFVHALDTGTTWQDLGLIEGTSSVKPGDSVSIRAVDRLGIDHFWPAIPSVVNNPDTWLFDLATQINTSSDLIRVGVLSPQGVIAVSGNASTFHVFATSASGILRAYLKDDPAAVVPPSPARVEAKVTASSPWYGELQVRLSHDSPITALTLDVNIKKDSGIRLNGSYNTIGGGILNSTAEGIDNLKYHFELVQGSVIPNGHDQVFAAQYNGTGLVHPTSGDTFQIRYTINGSEQVTNGTF